MKKLARIALALGASLVFTVAAIPRVASAQAQDVIYYPDGTLVLDYQDAYGDSCSFVVNSDGSSFTDCS